MTFHSPCECLFFFLKGYQVLYDDEWMTANRAKAEGHIGAFVVGGEWGCGYYLLWLWGLFPPSPYLSTRAYSLTAPRPRPTPKTEEGEDFIYTHAYARTHEG